jgi:hypothetical protein
MTPCEKQKIRVHRHFFHAGGEFSTSDAEKGEEGKEEEKATPKASRNMGLNVMPSIYIIKEFNR